MGIEILKLDDGHSAKTDAAIKVALDLQAKGCELQLDTGIDFDPFGNGHAYVVFGPADSDGARETLAEMGALQIKLEAAKIELDQLEDGDQRRQQEYIIEDIQAEIDNEPIKDSRQWVKVRAGSGYGTRIAYYEIIGGILVLRDGGEHDNLSGNSEAAKFQGVTLAEANDKADALNSEPRCGQYDGCHWCGWSIEVDEVTEVPRFLTYREPAKKEIIEAAISVYNKEPGSMGRLKAAIRSIE